ncbi:hypothetical protein D3C85_933540 [compost metagenome]
MAILKPLIQKLWASGGAVVQPSDTKIETGWTAEVPPHQWENWIQNRQDQYLAHINERGIPEWDGTTDYLAAGKSYAQGSNGVLYKSVAASGPATTVQDPTTDATNTYWTPEVVPQATETERGSLRVGTQAEVNAGTLDTVSVTPNKLRAGFAISLGESGYIALPTWMGGLILQWMPVTTTVYSNGFNTATLPVTFPTAGLATVISSKAVSLGAFGCEILSTSQVRFTNSHTATQDGIVFAVGH